MLMTGLHYRLRVLRIAQNLLKKTYLSLMRIFITHTVPNPLIFRIKYATPPESIVVEPVTATQDSGLNTENHRLSLSYFRSGCATSGAGMAGKPAQTFVPAKRHPPIPMGRDYFCISIIVRRQTKSLSVHSLITPRGSPIFS